MGQFLRPALEDPNITKLKGAGYVLEEGALPGVGLKQGEAHRRESQRQRDGGKAATAADVDDGCNRRPIDAQEDVGVRNLRLDLRQGSRPRQVDRSVPIEQQLRVPP